MTGTRPPRIPARETWPWAASRVGMLRAGYHPRATGEPVRDPPDSAARRAHRPPTWRGGAKAGGTAGGRTSRPVGTRGSVIPGETTMAEDKGQAGGAAAIDDEEPAFDAPDRGSADELLDAGAHAPIDAMRHSTAHVMAEAVLDLFPGAKLGIGPAINDGFYYDFDLPRALTPADLEAIEARMRESIAAAHPFVRKELSF